MHFLQLLAQGSLAGYAYASRLPLDHGRNKLFDTGYLLAEASTQPVFHRIPAMSRVALCCCLFALCSSLSAQAATPPASPQWQAMHTSTRVAGLESRRFTAEHWWQLTLPGLSAERGFTVEQIGHSAEGRELRHVQWGDGPTAVLLWSQMHGDESTASMALADLLAWLGDSPDDPLVQQLRSALTLHIVPILNPDGAARFQRRNAQGIDINRDAAALATPEARALKTLRDRLQPAYGFNLHDQRPGYRAGDTEQATAIALLAPPFDAARQVNRVRARAIALAAHISQTLQPALAGKLARWDDSFNPRAFGDLMQQWGTSTVLLEAGGIEGDTQKQQLRQHTWVAIVAGLQAIGDGSHHNANPEHYHQLPENGAVWPDLLISGATVHGSGRAPLQADVLVNFRHPLSFEQGRISDIGDLASQPARHRIKADGLHLHALEAAPLQPDSPARLYLSRDADGEQVLWRLDGDLQGWPDLPSN